MPKRVRRFSQGSPIVSSYIREVVNKDRQYKDGDERKLPYLKHMSEFSLVVPTDEGVLINRNLEDDPFLTDRRVKTALEETKLINWCPGIKRFIPLSVTNDGNTLCHSTSVALWGIHDRDLILRGLISSALHSDQQEEFKRRWLPVWKDTCGDNYQDAEIEWNIQLQIANKTNRSARQKCPIYDPLEDLHIFVLANVIRRPIIIFADRPVRSTNEESELTPGLATLYLPLLWPPSQCTQSPIVLGYCDNYFAPLVTLESVNMGQATDDEFIPEVVPMVRENKTPIEVRYLTQHERTIQDQLLSQYLILAEIEACCSNNNSVDTLPVAKMTTLPLAETQNLLRQFLAARSRDLDQYHSAPTKPNTNKAQRRTSRFRCGNKNCTQYITNESMFPFCVNCYHNGAQPPAARRKNTTGNLALTPQSIEVQCTTVDCINYASVNSYPFCQSCNQLKKDISPPQDALLQSASNDASSLEDCWKKLAMGLIDEEFISGFVSTHNETQNQELLSKLQKMEVKNEMVYNNNLKQESSTGLPQESTAACNSVYTEQRKSSNTSARSISTTSYQGEAPLSEPSDSATQKSNPSKDASDWKRKVSWINEHCGNAGCSYYASIHTYPYCNQCSAQLKSTSTTTKDAKLLTPDYKPNAAAEPKISHIPMSRRVSGTAKTLPTLVQED